MVNMMIASAEVKTLCPYLCLDVCLVDHRKSYERSLMTFFCWQVEHRPKKKSIKWWWWSRL